MCIMPSTGAAGGNEEVIVVEKAAEAWRKSPSFLLDEVTITRLGEIFPPIAPTLLVRDVPFMKGKLIDEAEIVVAMASDWLQLDATDDWIRHDSGIVSSLLLSSDSGHLQHVMCLWHVVSQKVTVNGRSLHPG